MSYRNEIRYMYYINLDENSLLRIFPHLFHNQTSEIIAQEWFKYCSKYSAIQQGYLA